MANSARAEAGELLQKLRSGDNVSLDQAKNVFIRSMGEAVEVDLDGDYVKALTVAIGLEMEKARDAVEAFVQNVPLGEESGDIMVAVQALDAFDKAMDMAGGVLLTELIIGIRLERGELEAE